METHSFNSGLAADVVEAVAELDAFIDEELVPLQHEDDNIRFFDHRREWARTDVERGGIPNQDWLELIGEMQRRSDKAGWLRLMLPEDIGGKNASHLLLMAVRERLAIRGIGLHNPLEQEVSVVANNPLALLLHRYGTADQQQEYLEDAAACLRPLAFALTEPDFGSDATRLATTARRVGDDWVITGKKKWISFMESPEVVMIVFARTSGEPGSPAGITGFLVPASTAGVSVNRFTWTMNMPTDHAEITLDNVRVPNSAIIGEEDHALDMIQLFIHRNRMRQAGASIGAARFCVDRAVDYANRRVVWGQQLSVNQAVQFPLAELHAEATIMRLMLRETARALDASDTVLNVSDMVAICNYRANRLACEAADCAIQTLGANGYSRDEPLEMIYRVHRRYRITEGAEDIQIRNVARHLFGFGRARTTGEN